MLAPAVKLIAITVVVCVVYFSLFLGFRAYSATTFIDSGGEPFVNGGLYNKKRMTVTLVRKGDHWPYVFYPFFIADKVITNRKAYLVNDNATEINEISF